KTSMVKSSATKKIAKTQKQNNPSRSFSRLLRFLRLRRDRSDRLNLRKPNKRSARRRSGGARTHSLTSPPPKNQRKLAVKNSAGPRRYHRPTTATTLAIPLRRFKTQNFYGQILSHQKERKGTKNRTIPPDHFRAFCAFLRLHSIDLLE
ncbi:MAG TPA: hypothetical protein VEA63_09275, partial [Opitutus sp.]|nr:hypothetical protein [Opitutus sp.]